MNKNTVKYRVIQNGQIVGDIKREQMDYRPGSRIIVGPGDYIVKEVIRHSDHTRLMVY